MSSAHTTVLREALVSASMQGWRLAINSISEGFMVPKRQIINEYDTSGRNGVHKIIEVIDPRWQSFGLFVPGGFDLLGWQTIIITPDMVGAKLAVFTAVDAKTKGYADLSDEQKNFAGLILNAGGLPYRADLDEDERIKFTLLSRGGLASGKLEI